MVVEDSGVLAETREDQEPGNGRITELMERLSTSETKDRKGSGKREGYLQWEDYFMAIAKLAAMRSKDPSTQVGCAIVNRENKVIGTGYNGFPVGIDDDLLPWTKGSANPGENKHAYVVHAEVNAIINKSMNCIEGCTMYTTMLPCNECAKIIIQTRIAEVVFLKDRPIGNWQYDATRRMFDLAGVKYTKFQPSTNSITIDFSC
ncbi:unnamed protein product [Nippostrongylus brasiliensis]|uniref:Probable deoxycytidylate deaminase n=1 Tax=Nippostrongylus brasiliensis TaxID=27835 RepID=A0A0N4Y418_NIPBR|nr:hypothetical protein Q1695_008523 [Nippostrongylus brasiliensis]VDL74196.1 unnamed protein product [Nippostrongylus brasiliensis]